MAINKISEDTINAILRKTAFRLPDNPSEQGMKAADIKKAFYQFIDDATASLCSEVNRIVAEANDAIDNKDVTVDTHTHAKDNPHEVTKAQVGLGNADNTSDMDKPISTAQQTAIDLVQASVNEHKENLENPHGVTKEQLGLGNVDNTADADKPISTAQQAAFDLKLNKEDVANNLTTDDETKALSAKQGKILNENIPTIYGYSIETTYVAADGTLTIILKDKNSNVLSTSTVDLPLELLLASSGSYYNSGVLYLKLANGSFISVDVSDLVIAHSADNTTIEMSQDGTFSISADYKAKINDAYNTKHSHNNFSLLETYTETNDNLKDAVNKKHEHSNKSILDATTASFTTAEKEAIANVKKQSATITISIDDWAGGTSCTKSIPIVSETNDIFYTPDESSYSAFTNAEIRATSQGSGTLTFKCSTMPQESITLHITALGG